MGQMKVKDVVEALLELDQEGTIGVACMDKYDIINIADGVEILTAKGLGEKALDLDSATVAFTETGKVPDYVIF